MGATNAKVYISLFSGKTKFVGESTQQYVKHLGSSVEIMFEEPETSNKVQHFLGNLFKNSVRSAEVKIEDLKDSIGKRPATLHNKLVIPDQWTTVGEV